VLAFGLHALGSEQSDLPLEVGDGRLERLPPTSELVGRVFSANADFSGSARSDSAAASSSRAASASISRSASASFACRCSIASVTISSRLRRSPTFSATALI
jgi:hypothetical protein